MLTVVLQARNSLFVGLALLISVSTDTSFFSVNSWRVLTGYGALTVHALTSSALGGAMGVLSPSLGSTFTIGLTTLGASIFALPFYLFRSVLVGCIASLLAFSPHCRLQLGFPIEPALPLMSLVAIPLIAYALLFSAPITAHSLAHLSFTPQYFKLSYPTIATISAVLGILAFTHSPTWSDLFVAGFLYAGGQHDQSFSLILMAVPCRHVPQGH